MGKADLVSDVAVVSCSRVSDVEFPSEAVVQSAVQQLVALFEAACQLGAPAREHEVEHLEDDPRDRRDRPVHEEFVPVLGGGVRQSSLRGMRFRHTPRR